MSAVQHGYPAVLGISSNITSADLLEKTNAIRAEKGLPILKIDGKLSAAASNKAADMFTKNYWAHVAPDGVSPWVFIKNSGYNYLYAGENLARGFTGTSEVVEAWMESPSHRDNMLSPNYSDVGFAIATGSLTGSDTVLVVEMFGTKYDDNSPVAITLNIPPKAFSITTPVISAPTTVPIASSVKSPASDTRVASIQQSPLIDKNDMNKNIIISVIILIMGALIIDAIVIERKKIIRAVSHNIDHIIYLAIILLTLLVLGKGVVI